MGEAGKLASEWNETSMRAAVEKFRAARSLWQSLGDTRREVEALDSIARIYVSLSEYQNALDTYNEGLKVSTPLGDPAQALNGISAVYTYLGQQQRALKYATRALELSERAGDKQRQAESRMNIGLIYYFKGDIQKAIETLTHALALSPDRTWRERGLALVNVGYAHFDLREMDKALDFYEQSLAQARSDGNRRVEALALTAIGGVHSFLGNKHVALKYHSDAAEIFRTVGDGNGEAVALNGLGYAYGNVADFQKSLDCYLRALELFRRIGAPEYETYTITRVGTAYEGLGDSDKALEYYELAFNRAAEYPQTRVSALASMGSVLESLGETQKALRYYNRALTLCRAIGDQVGEASILNSIGKVTASSGFSDEALTVFRRALAISRAVRDRRGEVSVLLNISETQIKAKDYVGAEQTIKESLKLIESMRTEIAGSGLRASYFASVRKHYELYVDIFMHLDQVRPAEGFREKAFAVSEQARARSFLELLEESQNDLRRDVDPALTKQARALEVELSSAAERHRRLLNRRETEAAAEIKRHIDQLSAQHEQIEAEIKSRSPRYAALTQPQPLTVQQIQHQVLDDDSILLEYMIGEERSYVWVVTRTEISSYELAPRVKIETAARTFRELLTVNQPKLNETLQQYKERVRQADAQLPAAAAALSDLLIGPVHNKLGTRRLIIVADGALHYIPFQALTVPPASGDAASANDRIPLLAHHEIVYQPSASALAVLLNGNTRPAPQNAIAVFANPVFEADDARVRVKTGSDAANTQHAEVRGVFRDLGLSDDRVPALPASRDEAEAILSFAPWGTSLKALDFDASRKTVSRPELAHYRIVHFATHGFVDYEHPELSGLVLSLVDENGQPQDGYLRLHDIYNLKLSANLVVLSACNTGLGKEIKGEGLIGLTRGFMYAGAGGVAASLWKVDDDATAALMTRFYEGMFQKGLTPAAAMREAQLWMWQQERWRSPYFWAAFIIQGRYDQVQNTGFSSSRAQTLVASSGVVSMLLLMACLAFGRRRSRAL